MFMLNKELKVGSLVLIDNLGYGLVIDFNKKGMLNILLCRTSRVTYLGWINELDRVIQTCQ